MIPGDEEEKDAQAVTNQDAFTDLLAEVFPRKAKGLVELRALPSKKRIFVDPSQPSTVRRFVEQHAQQDLFFGVATRLKEGDGRLENCGDLWTLFTDIDFKVGSEADARGRLDAFALRPSIVVASGSGWHVYFLLRTVVDLQGEADRVRRALRSLAHALGGDLSAAEPARILRVPGTLNRKYDPPRPVTIELFEPQRLYKFAEIERTLTTEPEADLKPSSFAMPSRLPEGTRKGGDNERTKILHRLIEDPTGTLYVQHRDDLQHSGLTDETIERQRIRTVSKPMIKSLLGFTMDGIESVMLLPFPDPAGGFMDHIRLKVFPPLRDAKSHAVKYLQPKGSGVRLFFPLLTLEAGLDGHRPLFLVEGEKKALAVAQLGLLAVGFCGIEGWHAAGSRALLPDFEWIRLRGRRIDLLPDGDWQTNPNVERGAFGLAEALETHGATVRLVVLPTELAHA